MHIDLEDDLRNFEVWLNNVNSTIENLIFNYDWDLFEIEVQLNKHKV